MKQGSIYRDGQLIVPQAWCADRPWSRLRGLLGRSPLHDRALQALWLTPCGGVHTFGMSYALDLVFLDRSGRVVDCCESVSPWRIRQCRGARQTVELASGSIATLSPMLGEDWSWRRN